MASKSKKAVATAADAFKPDKAYPLSSDPNDRDKTARNTARLASFSTVAATRVISAAEGNTGIGEFLDIPALISVMREQATAVQAGSLDEAEAMLINQATALQSLFARLTEKSMSAEYMSNFEAFMRMALRAQSQCRATLETLAAIKNPPTIYARQANVTTGPQQINNGTAAASHAQKPEIEQTQLSGNTHELLPDTRTSSLACGVDTQVETLGEIDRAEIPRG